MIMGNTSEEKTNDLVLEPESVQAAQETIEKAQNVVDQLDPEQKKAIMTLQAVEYQGPLPPPQMLQGYEDIEKGLASRIVAMAEKDQQKAFEHREKVLKFQGRDSLLGAIFSFLTVIVTLVVGTILLLNNKDVGGLVALITGVGTIIKLFLGDRNKKDDSEKHS